MKRYIHEPKTYVNEVVYNNYGTTYPSTNSATVVSNTGQSGPSAKSVTLIELQQILSNYLRIDNVPDELVEAVAAKLDPVIVDGELSTTSVNPVQNKVITHYIYQLDEKDLKDIIDSTGLKDTWSNKQDQLTFNEGIENDSNTINVLYNSNKLELDQDNQITLKYEYIKQLTDFSNYSPSSNEIVQYVGPTDDNYTNGYIYKYTNRWIPVLSNDVILYYDSTNTKLQIKDSLGDVISEIDASDFVKDGMLSSVEFYNEAEQGVSTVAPYVKFTFNTDGGDNVIRVSLVDIVPIIDTELDLNSNNAVRNSVITTALNLKANSNDLATVATSGSYNDLINKPEIPVVNDGTLTLKVNGTTKATFSANKSTSTEFNVEIPKSVIQVDNMSTYEGYENQIVEYTGSDTQDYKNGYFYKNIPGGGSYVTTDPISIECKVGDFYGEALYPINSSSVITALGLTCLPKVFKVTYRDVDYYGLYFDKNLVYPDRIPYSKLTDDYCVVGAWKSDGSWENSFQVSDGKIRIKYNDVSSLVEYTNIELDQLVFDPRYKQLMTIKVIDGTNLAFSNVAHIGDYMDYRGGSAGQSSSTVVIGSETRSFNDSLSVYKYVDGGWERWDVQPGFDPLTLATVATSGNYNDLINKPTIPVVPTDVSAFNNDVGYLTQHQDITSLQPKELSQSIVIGEDTVSTVEDALNKLNNKAVTITVDSELSDSSENPVQNKVIKAALDNLSSTEVSYSNNKFIQTIDGVSADIVTTSTLKSDMKLSTISTTEQNNVTSTIVQGDTYINNGNLNVANGDVSCIPSQGSSAISLTGLNTNLNTKVTNGGGVGTIVSISKSDYDDLETKDQNTMYVITDNNYNDRIYLEQVADPSSYIGNSDTIQYVGETNSTYTYGYIYTRSGSNWVQTNVQPTSGGSSTNPIKVFSASSISSDLSNINTQILSVNDLVVISDIISGTPLTYSVNNVTKTLNGNPDFDILFRYVGNGSFKPIALPSIIN